MNYEVFLSKQANKDLKKLKEAGLIEKVKVLLEILENDPYKNPPYFEKLLGKLEGAYSRRINVQYRLVYSVDDKEKMVYVERLWTHYEYMLYFSWLKSLTGIGVISII